jgi:DNA-binding CsgD family transcriptional regulator
MPLIGRRSELDRIDEAIDDVAGGRARVLLIGGDAGIGKSCLLGATLDRAREAGFAVGTGACIELSTPLRFLSVRAALRDLVQELDLTIDEPALVPLLAGRAAGHVESAIVMEAFAARLDDIARRSPIALAVEDLHWADESTVELLTYVARHLYDQRVLLVATFRGIDVLRGHPAASLVAEAQRLPTVARIDLTGLDRSELRAFIRLRTSSDPSEDFLDELDRRSGGNPFFATELLHASIRRPGALPASIADVLTLRLDPLPDDAAEVVAAAAVLGDHAPVALLSRLVTRGGAELDGALRVAVDAQVLTVDPDGDVVRFRHALLAEAAYSRLLPAQRRTLHATVAALLEDEPALVERDLLDAARAHHFDRAGDVPAALGAYLRAADAAIDARKPVEAVRQYERALDLWDRVEDPAAHAGADHFTVLMGAARAALEAGREEGGIEFLDRLLAVLDPETDLARWVEVVREIVHRQWFIGDTASALVLIDEGMARLPEDRRTRERSLLLERRGFMRGVTGAAKEGLADSLEAVAIAREIGDRSIESYATVSLGVTRCNAGAIDEGLDDLRRGCALARETDNAVAFGRGIVNIGLVLNELARPDEAQEACTIGLEIAREMGLDRSYVSPISMMLAGALTALGEWDDANRVLDRPGLAWQRTRTYEALVRAQLALGQGELDAAEHFVALAAADPLGNVVHDAARRAVEAELYLAQHRFDRAAEVVDGAIDSAEANAPASAVRLCAIGAHVAALRRDAAGARRWADRAERDATGASAVVADAPAWAAAARAWTATTATARIDAWTAAADAFEAADLVVRAADARAELAAALLDAGDAAAAEPILHDAREVASRAGALPLLARVDQLMSRAGADDVATGPGQALGLTDREVQVLRLVAMGRTNREIGGELFISVKTASVHVSNILRKVGAGNRTEAAALAQRVGLVA